MKLHSAERTSLWHLKNTNTAALSTTLLRLYYKHFFLFNLFHSYLLTPHADGVSVTLRVVPLGELVIQQYALLKESQSPYYGPVLKGTCGSLSSSNWKSLNQLLLRTVPWLQGIRGRKVVTGLCKVQLCFLCSELVPSFYQWLNVKSQTWICDLNMLYDVKLCDVLRP